MQFKKNRKERWGVDKLEWDDLTEAAIELISKWENKRKKNKRMKMVVQLEYSKIEVFFLDQHNDEILKSFKFLRKQTESEAIPTYSEVYNFIKNSHK